MTEKEKYVAELRCLADFYEKSSAELPRPVINREVFSLSADIIPVLLRGCGRLEKSASGGYIELTKTLVFGSIIFNLAQEKVCERKVVGQTWVETRPAIPGHHVDQVEWECKPILKGIEESE